MQNIEQLGASNDITENKQLSYFSDDLSKIERIETQELSGLSGSEAGGKKGAPKNEALSNDVDENKGLEKSASRMSNDVIENRRLVQFSNDVYENKSLNTVLRSRPRGEGSYPSVPVLTLLL